MRERSGTYKRLAVEKQNERTADTCLYAISVESSKQLKKGQVDPLAQGGKQCTLQPAGLQSTGLVGATCFWLTVTERRTPPLLNPITFHVLPNAEQDSTQT